ncbi:hypothetical protein BJY52DRAFT_1271107, partial [Lactarius psammicola]
MGARRRVRLSSRFGHVWGISWPCVGAGISGSSRTEPALITPTPSRGPLVRELLLSPGQAGTGTVVRNQLSTPIQSKIFANG